MAWTEEDLAAIEEAIANPARDIYIGGQRITSRSINDLVRIRDLIAHSLGKSAKMFKILGFRRDLDD